jgi:2-amino-4-hydroxy-6-hydroxymethyldihydropteridine diphosphokinase
MARISENTYMGGEHTAYVAVGSNIRPDKNIDAALVALMHRIHVTGVSSFYKTAPIDRPEQQPFYNGVWQISTRLSPRVVKFQVLRRIETKLGRKRTKDPHAPRTIDLDLILYGNKVIDTPDFYLPDPDIASRPFVAIPLLELHPNLVIPGTGERLSSLAVANRDENLEKLHLFTNQLRSYLSMRNS